MFAFLVLLLALALDYVDARAVFAHFMVTNSASFSVSDWEAEIGLAQDAHIDAFALNMAHGDPVNNAQLPNAFSAANNKGFKLFFSFDYAGSGPWPISDVVSKLQNYKGNGAYYYTNGLPFVSTFEGPGNATDWPSIKSQVGGIFFMPDWSSLGAKSALEVAPGVPDGLFSWAAWPWGANNMQTFVDASYRQYLSGMPYMMPVSPWFYTNLPGYNKNWLWRGDSLWLDRWEQVLYLQPEFVEIISWNDYGESHYIGPLHDNGFAAFTIGEAPFNYAGNMPHDGWRLFLPFLIDTYKTGNAAVTQEFLVMWYRLTYGNDCSDGGTTGNTASQLQIEFAPSTIVQDKVFYAALLASDADVTVSIGGDSQAGEWVIKPPSGVGIYHGSVPFNSVGEVVVTISRNGQAIATGSGPDIGVTCPNNNIQNWNAWVGSAMASGTVPAASPPLPLSERVCIAGTSVNNFIGLCEFTCQYGYCPEGACTCNQMGGQKPKPTPKNVDGYPIAGEDASYSGLCSFACNYDYCPPTACGHTPVPLATPTVSDFLPVACIAGTGNGDLEGLCNYACNYGYCPMHSCSCTKSGALNEPPPVTKGAGYAAPGMDPDLYDGLCNFACSRNYCPPPCTYIDPSGSNPGSFSQVPCSDPSVAASAPAQTQWAGAKAEDAWTQAISYWNAHKSTEKAFSWAISDFFGGSVKNLDCGNLAASNGCQNPDLSCSADLSAAGALIMNSFQLLESCLWDFYDAVGKVDPQAGSAIGPITSTFSDFPTDNEAFKIFMDVFGLVYALGVAPLWNSVFKDLNFFKNGNNLGTLKDSVNALVSNGVTISKDVAAADTGINTSNELSTNLNNMVSVFYDSIDTLNSNLFSGNPDNITTLHGLITGGQLVEPNFSVPDENGIQKNLLLAIYSVFIPMTWQLSPVAVNPFVLSTGIACGDVLPTSVSGYLSDPTATLVCGNDNMQYFLVGCIKPVICSSPPPNTNNVNQPEGNDTIHGIVPPPEHSCAGAFDPLPGSDQLTAANIPWQGLTRDDLVQGAVNTYNANNKQNGQNHADPLDPNTVDQLLELNNRAPGIVNIPVCGADEARANWNNALYQNTYSANYPCN